MATSCIYFVLVLTILSLRHTSAAFHDNDNITRNHNFNNINSTNTNNNNINYNNTNINNNYNNNNNIESATQHSAGILPYNESSASELSSTNKNNNYSIYQAEKERYKEYPNTDSTLIITETDSEASNTQKNHNKSNGTKYKKEDNNNNNNVIIQTERQHFGDTDIFGAYSLPDDPIYTNEFAVHIPAGKYVADGIADKYGFINRGQVIIGNR